MIQTQVLIVGGGPTGLVLAHWLKRLAIPFRLIDKELEPGTTSRALVMHARTLEFYQQMGLAETIVHQGLRFTAVNLWANGEHRGRVPIGDIGEGLSPFPYMLIYPQDEHEKFLIGELQKLGVTIERGIELQSFAQNETGVTAELRHLDGRTETCTSTYIAGCDGAHSTVRRILQMPFAGATYQRLFYVADVEADGPLSNGELHVALDEADFLAVFPLKQPGQARLIGTVVMDPQKAQAEPTWNDVGHLALDRLKMTVKTVHWFSTYRVHHRMTESFATERAFLLGDAAHIHSPVGGQGMNTGIGDAVNLAWKLAAVVHHQAPHEILQTYSQERMAFARRLVSTTDRAFTFVTKDGPLARRIRLKAVPAILPRLLSRPKFRRFFFRTISQISVQYRTSWLSAGRAGRVHGGDRVPWVGENFAPLAALNWQLHVYGEAPPALVKVCRPYSLPVHIFPWRPVMENAGLLQNAAYLIRPDGYIGLADAEANPQRLTQYLQRIQLPKSPD